MIDVYTLIHIKDFIVDFILYTAIFVIVTAGRDILVLTIALSSIPLKYHLPNNSLNLSTCIYLLLIEYCQKLHSENIG